MHCRFYIEYDNIRNSVLAYIHAQVIQLRHLSELDINLD